MHHLHAERAQLTSSISRLLALRRNKLFLALLFINTYIALFYTTMLANGQAIDAPTNPAAFTTSDAQMQLQGATADIIAMQERLRTTVAVTPSQFISASQLVTAHSVVAVGRTVDWTPTITVVAAVAPPLPLLRPLAYNTTCTVQRTSDDNQPNTLRWCIEQSGPLSIIDFAPALFPK
jgi:hypothetical protein